MDVLLSSQTVHLEKRRLTLGFVPLTDAASLIMAHELGFFAARGLEVTLARQSSWAALRDRLVQGELDAAHALYGLIYGTHLGLGGGLGGPAIPMAVLMGLNHNGQAITLSSALQAQGVRDGASLRAAVAQGGREFVFAQTFPTGTHALWLNYWLAAHGIDPLHTVRTITVPPPRMVAGLRAGTMDGFCAGEPWCARAETDGVGFTVATSQEIWADHPEKVLGATASFARQNPETCKAMIGAILEASRYVDDPANRETVAAVLARPEYLDIRPILLLSRMPGVHVGGLRFFNGGEVNFPYASHGAWFITQYQRWGWLEKPVDALAVAREVNQVALYAAAAEASGVAVPGRRYQGRAPVRRGDVRRHPGGALRHGFSHPRMILADYWADHWHAACMVLIMR